MLHWRNRPVHTIHKRSVDILVNFSSASGHLTHCRVHTRCTEFHTFRVLLLKLCFRHREKEINAPKRESISMVVRIEIFQEFFTFHCSVPSSVPLPTARAPWSRPVSHHEQARLKYTTETNTGLPLWRWTRLWTRPHHREECALNNPIICRFRLAPCEENFLLCRLHSSPQT